MAYSIKQGALEPAFEAALWDETEDMAIDPVGANSIDFRMAREGGGKIVVGTCDIVNGTDDRGRSVHKARYEWQPGDTSKPGHYRVEITLQWAGSGTPRPQTIPNDGWYELDVVAKA